MTTLSIRELAKALDVGPADALDIAIQNGVAKFWHEGQRLPQPVRQYLSSREWVYDPKPELEFESTPALDALLWRFEAEQIISEAAVEIANLDDPANAVCKRLRGLLKTEAAA